MDFGFRGFLEGEFFSNLVPEIQFLTIFRNPYFVISNTVHQSDILLKSY